MFATLMFLLNVVVGYLVGSICSAVIVCRLFALPDPRTEGSQNPGATNVMRLAGKKYAVIVLLADMLKGLLPVLFAQVLGAHFITVSFTCLAVVLGHMYPIFFGFKGGKSVATMMGAMLGLHFIFGVYVMATWLIIANFSRYSSLASIISVVFAPFYSLFSLGNLDAFIPLTLIAILILYKHRSNINRLIDGNEPKIILFQKLTNDDNVINEPQPVKTSIKSTATQTTPKMDAKIKKKSKRNKK